MIIFSLTLKTVIKYVYNSPYELSAVPGVVVWAVACGRRGEDGAGGGGGGMGALPRHPRPCARSPACPGRGGRATGSAGTVGGTQAHALVLFIIV